MILRILATSLIALVLGLSTAMAQTGQPTTIAPNLRVSLVAVASGRLVIIGSTLPNTVVTLDQRFNARANGRGDFTFSLLYVVEDCIVDLSTRFGLGRALVGNCGPKGAVGAVGPTGPDGPPGPLGGVSHQGEWDSYADYQQNDIVFWRGSTWIATDEEDLGEPGTSESGWILFAEGGEDGSGAGNVMYAVVDGDGTWRRGYPDSPPEEYTSQRVEQSAGTYEVLFGDNDITGCAFLADIGSPEHSGAQLPGFVTVVGRVSIPEGVFVQTFDTSGALADRPFHLTVVCPSVGQ
jgi:hypothetical protein